MKTSELRQRLEQLEGYSKTLVQAVRVMDERRHILEPLLKDEEVKCALGEKFRNTFGAHAYNHLVPLFTQDLVRDLARLFLDQDRRSGSLINLYRKASESEVYSALREQFRRIPDKWYENADGIGDLPKELAASMLAEMQENHRKDFEASFDSAWDEVSKAVSELEADPISAKLKTFRDKYHAHLEMSALGQDPAPFNIASLGLTYNDILAFSDRYMRAAFELDRLISGTVSDPEEFSELHRQYGAAMWRILAGLDLERRG
ncbi:MAG: AbiU2 domain-containing protein [Saccharospirillum sp.]